MLVYRVCSASEINYILDNGNFIGVGGLGINYDSNHHHYQDGYYYMHFFLDHSSIAYHSLYRNRYVCTYDIPDELFLKCQGIGEYSDRERHNEKVSLPEVAIRTVDMKPEFLRQVEELFPKDELKGLCSFVNSLDQPEEGSSSLFRGRIPKAFSRIFK